MISLNPTNYAAPLSPVRTQQVRPDSTVFDDEFIPSGNLEPRADLQFKEAAQKWGAQKTQQTGAANYVDEEIVKYFPDRNGYDVNFLGTPLPLPKLSPAQQKRVAPLIDNPKESVLNYTNFSIIQDKERRQPMLTAANIDGSKLVNVKRSNTWAIDGRIAREHQMGNEAYRNNPIDRGHQVRRADPAWGENAKQASDDTFVYTNSSLQHERLNQGEWLQLENHILDTARNKGAKMTVLTGPVFADDDPVFDNNGMMEEPGRIPQEYWKVVAWNDSEGNLKGSAFVVSQKDYVGADSPYMSDDLFTPGRFSVYQVPMEQLEKATGLKFGLSENTVDSAKRINDVSDSVLPF